MIQRMLSRFRSDERGAVLLIVALGAVVMVGISALAIDLGMLYTARSEAQRAADAAALAGASAFQDGDPLVEPDLVEVAKARAYETAGQNSIRNVGIDPTPGVEVTVQPIPTESKVRVTIRRENIGLWFAQILGIRHATVSAKAAAEAAPASAASPAKCIKPFAIPDMWKKPTGSSQDGNSNQIWDFEPHDVTTCDKHGKCTTTSETEKWTWESGDTYGSATSSQPTGYGSAFRNGIADGQKREPYVRDQGRRIPIKIETVPSYWQVWAMTGRGRPAATDAIKTCYPDALRIGQDPDGEGVTEIETEPGNMANPIYDAFMDLIKNGEKDWKDENGVTHKGREGDPNAYWDEATGTVKGSKFGEDWQQSARVMTVALFNPQDMGPGRHKVRFVDFALLFLENPERGKDKDDPFWNDNPKHQRPITGRILKFTPGDAGGGTEVGNLPKILRLVE